MIDLKNSTFKMLKISNKTPQEINDLLIPNETIISTYHGVKDYVIFTTKRIIAVGAERVLTKKKEYTSLPSSKVQAFSVETAGGIDIDSELELYFSSLGKVKFEFTRTSDIMEIGKIISQHIL